MVEEIKGGGGSELTGGYRSNPLDAPSSDLSSQGDAVIQHGDKVLSDGRPIGKLSVEDAKLELRGIEAPDSPLWGGDMPYWERQRLLRRRDGLYKQVYPEKVGKPYDSMADTLKGITPESFQRDVEKYEERDDREAKNKSMDTLERRFGSEKGADVAIQRAQKVIERIAGDSRDGGESLKDYLDTTRMGDSPFLIEALAMISTNKPLMNRLVKVNEGMAGGGVVELLVEVAKTLGIGGKKKR